MTRQQEIYKRVMDLAIDRVFKGLHSRIGKEEKLHMEKVFESGTDEEKEKFIKKYLPDFESSYKDELEKLAKELMDRI